VDWIELAQNLDKWKSLVNKVVKVICGLLGNYTAS
jgi:hypothetical protein